MNENMVLMATRERQRIKQGILCMAEKRCFVSSSGRSISAIMFNDSETHRGLLLNGYKAAARSGIMQELTLEIIDELIENLTTQKRQIIACGEEDVQKLR